MKTATLATRFRKGDYITFISNKGHKTKAGRVISVSGDFVVVEGPEGQAEVTKGQCFKSDAKEYNRVAASTAATPGMIYEDGDDENEGFDDEEELNDDEADDIEGKEMVPKRYVQKYKELSGERHCADAVAMQLKDMPLDQVYKVAAKILGLTQTELMAKYGHLNNGQQRMNLGNRMRNALKKKAD